MEESCINQETRPRTAEGQEVFLENGLLVESVVSSSSTCSSLPHKPPSVLEIGEDEDDSSVKVESGGEMPRSHEICCDELDNIGTEVKIEVKEEVTDNSPGRRSLRIHLRVVKEEESSVKSNDELDEDVTFPDPRHRIRSLDLFKTLNDFLVDIGTDPENIEFTDHYWEDVVLYEPLLPNTMDYQNTLCQDCCSIPQEHS